MEGNHIHSALPSVQLALGSIRRAHTIINGRYLDWFFLPGRRYASAGTSVGFVAAAVSMPMGGCRARRPVGGRSLVSAETVGVIVAVRPAVL